jgi:hypothetical protein
VPAASLETRRVMIVALMIVAYMITWMNGLRVTSLGCGYASTVTVEPTGNDMSLQCSRYLRRAESVSISSVVTYFLAEFTKSHLTTLAANSSQSE